MVAIERTAQPAPAALQVYGNGDSVGCPGGTKRSATVNFVCPSEPTKTESIATFDTNGDYVITKVEVPVPDKIVDIKEPDACNYALTVETPRTCMCEA